MKKNKMISVAVATIFIISIFSGINPTLVNATPVTTQTYPSAGPLPDKVVFKFYDFNDLYSGPLSMYNSLLMREIDLMDWWVLPDWYQNATAEEALGHLNISIVAWALNGFSVNCLPGRYPLNVTAFRKALASLVDRSAIISTGLNGDGYEADRIVPAILCPNWSNPSVKTYTYSLELANKTLWDAGFHYTGAYDHIPFGGGTWEDGKGNTLRPIEFMNRLGNNKTRVLGLALCDAMSLLDLRHTYTEVGWITWLENARSGNYDIIVMPQLSASYPGPLWKYFNSGSTYTYNPRWNNATYDYWSDLMMSSSDYHGALQACYRCQELLADSVPYIPVYVSRDFRVASTQWKGLVGGKATPFEFPGAIFCPSEHYYEDVNRGWINFYSLLQAHPVDRSYGGTLRVGEINLETMYPPLNPVTSFALPNCNILVEIYDTMVRRDPNTLQLQPWMAESYDREIFDWTPTQQGTRVTIVLRDNLTWHDGLKVTSEDVKFTYEWLTYSPARGGIAAPNYALWFPIHNVTTPNPLTAIIYANTTSYIDFCKLLQFPVLPKHIWSKYTTFEQASAVSPEQTGELIGSGPYVFESYIPGVNLTLRANRNYFMSPTWIPKPVTGLVVHVIDYNTGTGIAGATISTISQPAGQPVLTGETNSTGYVKFIGITAGDYAFEVFKDGYYYGYEYVSVAPSETTTKTATLDGYTGYGPCASQLIYKRYTNTTSEYLALRAGEIDLMLQPIPLAMISDAIAEQAAGNLNLSDHFPTLVDYLAIHCESSRYPLNDTGFRKALAYMIDRQRVVVEGLDGHGGVLDNFVSGEVYGVWSNPNVKTYSYSLADSNTTLWSYGYQYVDDPDEPGFSMNSFPFYGGRWIDKNGYPIRSIWIISRIDDLPKRLVGQFLDEAMTQLDLDHTRSEGSYDYIVQNVLSNPHGSWDVFTGDYTIGIDTRWSWSCFNSKSTSGNNFVFWNNSTFDYWSDRIITESDFGDSLQANYKAQECLADGLPWIPLFQKRDFRGCTTSWKGWVDMRVNGWNNIHSLIDAHPSGEIYGGTLRVGWFPQALTFNPVYTGWAGYYGGVLDLIYDRLVRYNPYTLGREPAMAKSYSVEPFNWTDTEQGQKITLVLREGLKWHDGMPVTSEDIAFTYRWLTMPPSRGGIGAQGYGYKLPFVIHNITTPDSLTAILYVNTTWYFAINSLTDFFWVLPEHIWSAYTTFPAAIAVHPEQTGELIGSGPYRFVQYVPGEYVRLKAFADYIKPPPELTAPIYTPMGLDVAVNDRVTQITVVFDEVTDDGATVMVASEEGPAPPYQFNFAGLYYHIMTDASYTGTITIAIPYNESLIQCPEENLRLMHWDASSATWVDITTEIDVDNNIVKGTVTSLSIFAIVQPVDSTPPSTELTVDIHYVDEAGNIYVTSETDFGLSASDDISGVDHTYYRINNGEWVPYTGGNFRLQGVDGKYVISYYSIDNMGNAEPEKSIAVNLVSLKVSSYVTKGGSDQITYFDVIFSGEMSGECRLVATNPGELFYNVEVVNNWPTIVSTLTINLAIPGDFVLKGGDPIHIYLNGNDVTSQCTITGTTITIADIASGGTIRVRVHLDYALKGALYPSLDTFAMRDYFFHARVCGSDDLMGSYASATDLMAHQKKTTAIAGLVSDGNGNAINGATVGLFDSLGHLVATTTTDENGFYYFVDIAAGTYTVKAVKDTGSSQPVTVAVAQYQLAQVDIRIG